MLKIEKFENVSILLPVINETFSVIQTVQIILKLCNAADIKEFIFIICEKTKSDSLKAIQDCTNIIYKANIDFSIIWQQMPFAGGAIREGIIMAKGSHTIMMASDLDTPPQYVEQFIDFAKKYPADIISGSRWLKGGGFSGYNKIKLILNFIFQKIFTIFYNVNLTDITYCYRIAPTILLQSIAWEEVKHPFYLETALKPICLGISLREIPVKWVARLEGSSQNSFFQTFNYLGIAIKTKFKNRDQILKTNI